MTDIQNILNQAIHEGFYDPPYFNYEYMCISLLDMSMRGIITHGEHRTAIQEIGEFIAPEETLNNFLVAQGIPVTPQLQLKIYQNWEKRHEIIASLRQK